MLKSAFSALLLLVLIASSTAEAAGDKSKKRKGRRIAQAQPTEPAELPTGDDDEILVDGDDGEDAEGPASDDELIIDFGGEDPAEAPPAPLVVDEDDEEQSEETDAADDAAPAKEGEPEKRLAPENVATPEETRPFGFFQDLLAGVMDPTDNASGYQLMPFATIIGGGHYELVHRNPDEPTDQREDRFTTVAMSRMGVLANVGKWVQFESEFEVNMGPYGTSAWEGQGAIQVRNQLVRVHLQDLLYADKLVIEAGRVTDPTSLNFFSMHVANLMLSDHIGRLPVLYAGFNRGNGVQVRYTLFDQLTLGATVNAGNPTSNTGVLQVGGTFPPFGRFYEVPHSSVGRDASGFPMSSFHVMLLSPSIHYQWRFITAQASAQMISANTNTNSTKDEAIMGLNLRAGAQLQAFDDLFWDNGLKLFVNASRIGNGVVEPDNLAQLQPGFYEAYTGQAGFDLDLFGKSGIGADVAVVRESEPGATPTMNLFANVGATWWFTNTSSVSARYGVQQRCADLDCSIDGRSAFFVTLRTLLGPAAPTRP